MTTPRTIVISAVVRLARYHAGYSVAETARLAGVSPQALRRIESGNSAVRLETVLRVLKALEETQTFAVPLVRGHLTAPTR